MTIEIIKIIKKKIPLSLTQIRKKTIKILRLLNIEDCSLNIVLVSDSYIKKLNFRYLNKNRPTDVLSFGGGHRIKEERDIFLGEVVLSIDTLRRQALEYKHSFEEELYYCLIHGILHLLGYNDRTHKGYKEMTKLQEEILEKILKR